MDLRNAFLFYVVAGMGCAALALHSILPILLVGAWIYIFGELFDARSGSQKKGSRNWNNNKKRGKSRKNR